MQPRGRTPFHGIQQETRALASAVPTVAIQSDYRGRLRLALTLAERSCSELPLNSHVVIIRRVVGDGARVGEREYSDQVANSAKDLKLACQLKSANNVYF